MGYTSRSDATEHTLRGALENLLNGIARKQNPNIKIIHEPKKDQTGLGAPDFKFKLNEAILGYLENKPTGASLDASLKSAQIVKYKKLSGNIILTNYLEWIWLKDGHIINREALCSESDVGYYRARLDQNKAEKTGQLITNFLSTAPEKIAKASKLSLALAVRCHELRDFLLVELVRQAREHHQGRLYGLYLVFKRDVFHELELKEFADAFAQTLGYGLFLAKLNAGENTLVTLQNAKNYIPRNFELIRELVDFLDELEMVEYQGIKWLVEEILSIMNTLNLSAIHEDLAFTKSQGRLFEPTEEERLLFAKDPYIYFYEDFLKAYDKETRKSRGVYYTPPPVVNFIIRAVNSILKDTIGIEQGLADRRRVTVLDFAAGTGTFLVEVVQQVFEEVSEGIRDQIIQQHVLKNLYGFEYLIAPYTISHLKLSQFLHDKGYQLQANERLQIYLTNTLEPIEPQVNYLLPALSREVKAAQAVKEKPILVITGNPPYAGQSKNPSFNMMTVTSTTGNTRAVKVPTFIGRLISDFKKVDGNPLGEKNPRWLQNDYVKFIRFAQWKIDQVDDGIVGIITSHSFLDNPTFRGMRQSLMQTFNQIYILDLHGNLNKRINAPDGSRDENVFDIEEGVCISLMVKHKALERKIFYSELIGNRKHKYYRLLASSIVSTDWKILHPSSPFYLLVPQSQEGRAEYELGWKVWDMFIISGTGIITKRDDLCIHYTEEDVWKTIRSFEETSSSEAYTKFRLPQDVRDWKVEWAQADIQQSGLRKDFIKPVLYRPFDVRYTYYTGNARGFLGWPVTRIMRHILAGENIALITSRMTKGETFKHAQVTDKITEVICMSSNTSNNGFVFPLYLYPSSQEQEQSDSTLFNERIENFRPEFRQTLDKQYNHHYSPEDILGYIYAVLYSPTYRDKYVEFLKIDFPRIPFVGDRATFDALSDLGLDLIHVHLLKVIPKTPTVNITKGNSLVEQPKYVREDQRVYINNDQYFTGVPTEVWDFHIGGYQVLDKYLKSRKGRKLGLDEIENVQNVVKVLWFTIQQMQKIEEVWKP